MIAIFFTVGKCASIGFFLPLNSTDSHFNFPKNHFGNVAGCNTKDTDGFVGIKVQYMGKVLKGIEFICIQSAAGHQHIANTAYQSLTKPLLCVQFVQFFQKAVALYRS